MQLFCGLCASYSWLGTGLVVNVSSSLRLCFALHPFGYFLLYLFHCNLLTWTLAIPSLHWSAPSAAWTLWPGLRLSYREIIECRYIGLFSISKSISYRTSHIEYLDILKTSDFFVFFRRKFSENSENSPKIQTIPRKFRKPMNQSPQQQQQRRKFQKFAKNSENSPKIP